MVRLPTTRTAAMLLTLAGFAAARPVAAQEKVDTPTIERIKSEEMNNGKIMDIMS